MKKIFVIPVLAILSGNVLSAPVDIEEGNFKKNVEFIGQKDEQKIQSVKFADQYANTTIMTVPSSQKFSRYSHTFVKGTNINQSSMIQVRPRTELDVYEFSCLSISADINERPQLIDCLSEKDGSGSGIPTKSKPSDIDYKSMLSQTEIIELTPGTKLVSFDFNMDKKEPLTYTTAPMTSLDKPVIYSFTRSSSGYDNWSGKHGFTIREHR